MLHQTLACDAVTLLITARESKREPTVVFPSARAGACDLSCGRTAFSNEQGNHFTPPIPSQTARPKQRGSQSDQTLSQPPSMSDRGLKNVRAAHICTTIVA